VETFIDSRDQKVYKMVRIGNQAWLAENLAYIPHVSPASTAGGIWVYGYDGNDVSEAQSTANYSTYGCLYGGDTAKTVAPSGWHLPTEEEWKTLARFFGSGADDGNRMKQPGLWKRDSGATNSSGFSALPGGLRAPNGSFKSLGSGAHFWSATEFIPGDFWHYYMEDESRYVRSNPNSKDWGFSVRCIKD
jgi:uncharacterized protein (TIGR02145 family)